MSSYVSALEANEYLIRLETENDLLQFQVDGWCAWPTLRFDVGLALNNLPLTQRSRVRLDQHLIFALGDILAWFRLRPVHFVAKTYSSGLLEQMDGSYKDIWLDNLLCEIGNCFKIEGVNNPAFLARRSKAYLKSQMTTSTFAIMAGILARAKIGPRYIEVIASQISTRLINEPSLKVFTADRVARRLWSVYWSKKFYCWLLRRLRPEFVFTVDPGEYALVAAAKELNITTIEFQHGFLDGRAHYSYSWTEYALKYRAQMPIPDRFFLYGEHWKNELELNGFWEDTLRLVGSLRIDLYRKCRLRKWNQSAYLIVLTMQGIDIENTIAFMSEFLGIIHKHRNVELYVKLHPAYETSKSPYTTAFNGDPRVQIVLGSEEPSTFNLLARADLHLSISSTCHYDAIGLGVPTVILPFTSHEIVMPLKEIGHAFFANTPSELVEIVLQLQDYKVPAEIGEYYFKTGALENMKRELGLMS